MRLCKRTATEKSEASSDPFAIMGKEMGWVDIAVIVAAALGGYEV